MAENERLPLGASVSVVEAGAVWYDEKIEVFRDLRALGDALIREYHDPDKVPPPDNHRVRTGYLQLNLTLDVGGIVAIWTDHQCRFADAWRWPDHYPMVEMDRHEDGL